MIHAPHAGLRRRIAWAILVCATILAATRPGYAEERASCKTCHTKQVTLLATSVHNSFNCQECHGGPSTYSLSPDEMARYTRPTAPGEVRPVFQHGDGFTGKAKRADIPNLCGNCHADVERMNPYGIPTDQLSAYWTSGHGKTLKKTGDDRVAVCIDCHGSHDIFKTNEVTSRTYPANVPETCGQCHGNAELMGDFDLPEAIVDEYRRSVHGKLLYEQGDLGAPTCATCHGSHAAAPPGFASVRTACGQCHQLESKFFATSIHASQEEHKGCVQCHGGGPDANYHLIERITKPASALIQKYKQLMAVDPNATGEEVAEAIHPDPKRIINNAIESCTECHEDLEDDESLPKLFELIDSIAAAEKKYVETASYLDEVGRGVLLIDHQRFKFEDARTHLIALAPLQHTLDLDKVSAKVKELDKICDEVDQELTDLETNLNRRYAALAPMWGFCIVFSIALYAKFKQLKKKYVKPLP